MFHGLRFRLIASYVLVIFTCLMLAGSTALLLLRDAEQRRKLDEVSSLSIMLSQGVQYLEALDAPPVFIAAFLREQSRVFGVRTILTAADGHVLDDSMHALDGLTVPIPNLAASERRGDQFRAFYVSLEGGLYLVAPPLEQRPQRYAVLLAIPEANMAAVSQELFPRLGLAAAASLVVSILVALFLTRSIARPLVQMTRASEEIARGNYAQSIPVPSQDEVGRLAAAFNEMARQVATSDRTLRDFLANVSHELKTPLTSISGFSQAILDGTMSSPVEYQQAGAIISAEATRMRALVEDLLILSKIESGQIVMDSVPFDLDRLLREAVERTEWQVGTRAIRVDVDSRTGALVRGDAHWLGQVFSNLLDNAIRHTPPGGRIAITAHPTMEPFQVRVTVHNTGSYIPPEDQPRVFERFFQVDRSRASHASGSGLGLAIVKEVVQAHGGAVGVSSDPMMGTTFEVRLPLHSLLQPTRHRAGARRAA